MTQDRKSFMHLMQAILLQARAIVAEQKPNEYQPPEIGEMRKRLTELDTHLVAEATANYLTEQAGIETPIDPRLPDGLTAKAIAIEVEA